MPKNDLSNLRRKAKRAKEPASAFSNAKSSSRAPAPYAEARAAIGGKYFGGFSPLFRWLYVSEALWAVRSWSVIPAPMIANNEQRMSINFPPSWSEIVNDVIDFISACPSLQSLNFPTIHILARQRAQACCPHKSQPPEFPRPDVFKGNVYVSHIHIVCKTPLCFFRALPEHSWRKDVPSKASTTWIFEKPMLSKVLMIVFCDRAVFSSLSTAQAFQNSFGRRLPLQQWA